MIQPHFTKTHILTEDISNITIATIAKTLAQWMIGQRYRLRLTAGHPPIEREPLNGAVPEEWHTGRHVFACKNVIVRIGDMDYSGDKHNERKISARKNVRRHVSFGR